ncbi:MAG: hypothetical protein NTW28_33345 [Candidatus Solibacter sp.]|nr:hypothetical protein [Candidatus Solibacter sp.]
MKLVLFCLLAGVFPGWSETRGATFAPIALYTQFQQAPPEGVLQALQDEVEWIMAPIGLRFEWRDLGRTGGHEVSAELAVVAFKGRCDVAGLMTHSRFEGALGWTHVSDGQILPFTDVSCDRVRDFVQAGLMAIRAEDREEKYGRALGRVLAHELYHIFANTMRHGSMGVAKESYNVQDLLTDDFQFQAKESRMLQTSRPKPAAESTAGSM